MEVFGVKHRMTTPYHPQANGLDERYNQTLVNTVAKFAQEDRTTWDTRLGEVVYAYNTAVHESSKHTPFEVMFGRQALLPVDFNTAVNRSPEELVQEYEAAAEPSETEREAKRLATEEDVKSNIAAAQVNVLLYSCYPSLLYSSFYCPHYRQSRRLTMTGSIDQQPASPLDPLL